MVKTSGAKNPVQALVLRAAGTNCDNETVHALTLAGAECQRVHVNQLLMGRARLHPFQIVVIPGGFSYGDDISAGKVLANEMRLRLRDQLTRFVETKKLVIGVCNGFQVLVKSGLLAGFDTIDEDQTVTLTLNDSARFQCKWIGLQVENSAARWLDGLPKTMELPMAHGEGRFLTANTHIMKMLKRNNQIVFRYAGDNPNGSEEAIAGICNKQGNVVGLMPHPERYVTHTQHPNWTARVPKEPDERGDGYWFWEKAVAYARQFVD